MGCLIADFETWAPAKGAVVVAVKTPENWVPPWSEVRLVVDRLDLAGLASTPRTIRPLEGAAGSGLFRTFAGLPHTDDAVAGYATRFGTLGVRLIKAELPDGGLVTGEPVEDWQREQMNMAFAVALWDKLRVHDHEGVRALLPDHPVLPDPAWEQGDPLPAGWAMLGRYLSFSQLRGRGDVDPRLEMRPTKDRPLALQIVAGTQLGALWLQFAQAVDGDRDYRSCATCGQWFELDPAIARTNRRYCSDACRSKAYRTRKEGKD